MKKNHVWSGLMTTALVAGEIQAKRPMPNMSVITPAGTHSGAGRNTRYGNSRRGDGLHALLSELKISLVALQQHVAAMKMDTAGLTAQVTHVTTALNQVEADVNSTPLRSNAWIRRRHGGPSL